MRLARKRLTGERAILDALAQPLGGIPTVALPQQLPRPTERHLLGALFRWYFAPSYDRRSAVLRSTGLVHRCQQFRHRRLETLTLGQILQIRLADQFLRHEATRHVAIAVFRKLLAEPRRD